MKQENKPKAAVAPGMPGHDRLEEKASAEDIRQDDSTSVTRLYLDRTPDE